MLLGHWVIAAALGFAFGIVMLFASRSSFRRLTPEAPEAGLVFVAVSLFVRMGLAAALLFAYSRLVPGGFVPFAAGLAGGFLILYGVELAKYGKVLARS